jgi:hypothetical protein
MRLEIDQCLHGYQQGHQLLAASHDFPPSVKKILLFQTDLSGPNIVKGFEEYITGYPLEELGIYVLSKTWYAEEMKRPGCVWTHSLLIKFSDLSNLRDMMSLLSHLKRPIIEKYETYCERIVIDSDELRSKKYSEVFNHRSLMLTYHIYNNFDKTILIPSVNSSDYVDDVFQIWNDQWPRLRRNFYFSTGALSLKSIADREFDVQVVPRAASSLIERQSNTPYVMDTTELEFLPTWVHTISDLNSDRFKQLYWSLASDVNGNRKNFIPLMTALRSVLNDERNIPALFNMFQVYFHNPREARHLKKVIFGRSGLQTNSEEKQVIKLLLSAPDISFIDATDTDIELRLGHLVSTGDLENIELLDTLANALESRIPPGVWDSISLPATDIINYLHSSPDKLDNIAPLVLKVLNDKKVWSTSSSFQNLLLEFVVHNNFSSKYYLRGIESANAHILQRLYEHLGSEMVYWALENLRDADHLSNEVGSWYHLLLTGEKIIVNQWLTHNFSTLNWRFIDRLNNIQGWKTIAEIDVSYESWIVLYNSIRLHETKKNILQFSCVVFSLGLENKYPYSADLLRYSFQDVLTYARSEYFESRFWNQIPVDVDPVEYDRTDYMYQFLELVWGKRSVPRPSSKDYDELIIRTVVNKFIKFKWNLQTFMDLLSSDEHLKKAFHYCKLFPKGQTFLMDLYDAIRKRKVVVPSHQSAILRKL